MYLVPPLLLLLLKSVKFTSYHVICISLINFFSFLSSLLNVSARTHYGHEAIIFIYKYDFYDLFKGFVEKCFRSDWW